MYLPKRLPSVVFQTRVRDESIGGDNPYRWQEVTTEDLFEGKECILFALPGAFTPTCSNFQLPGYDMRYQEFIDLGIDDVYCLSVNDGFVMNAWADDLNIQKVTMIPDGNGDFTRALGMEVEKLNLGFGKRSWRYAAVINKGVVEKWFIEPGQIDNCPTDPYEVSDPDTVLNYLQ